VLGVTVILLSCSYEGREFVRVGYYVNNEYADETLVENPPAKPIIEKIKRNILAEKPRVTRFAIKWFVYCVYHLMIRSLITLYRDSEASAPPEFPPDQPEADTAPDDEAAYGAEEEVDEAETLVEAEPEPEVEGEDAEMGGIEKDDASEAGSEDIENDSSEDDEEDEEGEDEAEVEGDQDQEMDMGDDGAAHHEHSEGLPGQQTRADVMVH
jgi:histone chaperone ASF1